MRLSPPILAVAIGVAVGCQTQTSDAPKSARSADPAPTVRNLHRPRTKVFTIAIAGMHCEGCASGIRSELARLPGVTSARVHLKSARARVVGEENQVTTSQLIHAIEEAGYQARIISP